MKLIKRIVFGGDFRKNTAPAVGVAVRLVVVFIGKIGAMRVLSFDGMFALLLNKMKKTQKTSVSNSMFQEHLS